MSLLYVFVATKTEADAVMRAAGAEARRSSQGEPRMYVGPNEVLVATTGMGPRKARARAEELLAKEQPEAVIVTGSCGSLTSSLVEDSVVFYTACLSADGANSVPCSSPLADAMVKRLQGESLRCSPVVGVTAGRIATTTQEKLALGRTGASVVDMESYEVVAAATARGIASAVIRVVTDSLDRALPDFNRALNPNGEVSPWAMARLVLGSPILMAKLIGINRRAMMTLTAALRAVLSADWNATEPTALGGVGN